MTERIRVMVVDDSAVVRQTLKELLNQDPGIEGRSLEPGLGQGLPKLLESLGAGGSNNPLPLAGRGRGGGGPAG